MVFTLSLPVSTDLKAEKHHPYLEKGHFHNVSSHQNAQGLYSHLLETYVFEANKALS